MLELVFVAVIMFGLGALIVHLYYKSRIPVLIDEAVKNALNRSRASIKGDLAERFLPLDREKFPYNPSDARFIGDPIDYVIFEGYTDVKDKGEDKPIGIVLVEVKTGGSLTKRVQKMIEEGVKQKLVKFETIRISEGEENV